jgi:multidrug efflux pump subunit AcrB
MVARSRRSHPLRRLKRQSAFVGRGDERNEYESDLAKEMPDVRFSFEPSDIVNEVMSFGSPTPIEVVVSGSDFAKNREFAEKLRKELAQVPVLRDLQLGQSMDYPTVQVNVDREKAGMAGLMPSMFRERLVTATSSSRFVVPNYWADPKSGVAYQVQVEIPRPVVRSPYDVETIGSIEQLGRIPLRKTGDGQVLIQRCGDARAGHDARTVRSLQHETTSNAHCQYCRERSWIGLFTGSTSHS